MQHNHATTRIWELDFFRGLAILLMVFFHFLYDLKEFFQVPVTYESGAIYYTGRLAAGLFIFIAGMSCSLSRNNLSRGFKILAWGLAITLITSLAVPGLNIFFGILHFLGTSIILYHFINPLRPSFLYLLGALVIVTGMIFNQISMPNNFLAPLGLLGNDFYSADYYPLFPWLGLFLLGAASGKLAYPQKRSLFSWSPGLRLPIFLGRHSLFIYLVHQPTLLLVLYLFFKLY